MTEKPKKPTQAQLEKRAAERGYSIEKEGDEYYVEIGGTRWGPMASLDEVSEFLPEE